jgi:hypothetical protein
MVSQSEEAVQKEVDALFCWADDLFREGRYETFDLYLRALKPEEMSTQMIRSTLCVSRWAIQHLPSRPEFFRKATKVLVDRLGQGEADRLLNRL